MKDKAQYCTQTLHGCALASRPNSWTGEQLQGWGCLQGHKPPQWHPTCFYVLLFFIFIFFFFFLLKPCSSYTGRMTGAFPKKWSNATWVPGPAPKPAMHTLRGGTRRSQTAQCFTSVKTEETAGLCAEGATHTDPSMLDTFTGWV